MRSKPLRNTGITLVIVSSLLFLFVLLGARSQSASSGLGEAVGTGIIIFTCIVVGTVGIVLILIDLFKSIGQSQNKIIKFTVRLAVIAFFVVIFYIGVFLIQVHELIGSLFSHYLYTARWLK